MNKITRFRILGVPVDNLDISLSLKYIDYWIANGKKGNYILAVNPEKVIAVNKNSSLKNLFENAALLIPDGIGIVLAMRWLYKLSAKRVPGVDLMMGICKQSSIKGYKIYIFGSKEKVNRHAAEILKKWFPGISIVGRCDGYINEDNMEKLIQKINKSKADILFIALGSPKQEKWIGQYLPKLNVKVCQGVGGALDVISGRAKRAPQIIQNIGFEWLYRLILKPDRIRRQIILPFFALRVIIEKIKLTYRHVIF